MHVPLSQNRIKLCKLTTLFVHSENTIYVFLVMGNEYSKLCGMLIYSFGSNLVGYMNVIYMDMNFMVDRKMISRVC